MNTLKRQLFNCYCRSNYKTQYNELNKALLSEYINYLNRFVRLKNDLGIVLTLYIKTGGRERLKLASEYRFEGKGLDVGGLGIGGRFVPRPLALCQSNPVERQIFRFYFHFLSFPCIIFLLCPGFQDLNRNISPTRLPVHTNRTPRAAYN